MGGVRDGIRTVRGGIRIQLQQLVHVTSIRNQKSMILFRMLIPLENPKC